MTTRSYRGDAPAVSKVVYLPKPAGYTAGAVNVHINNKTITIDEWDAQELVDAWNASSYPETVNITASLSDSFTEDTGQYGTTVEPDGVILTADNPGEDFFVTMTLGDGSATITNEIQRLTFDPDADGGTFTLTYAGQTTGAITYDPNNPSATAAAIDTALEALSNIGASEVAVTFVSEGIYHITFSGTLAATDLVLMSCDYTNLTGGDVNITITKLQDGVLPTDEVQTLSLPTAPTGGTFTLTFDGQTTAAIAYNANAAAVQSALEGLSNIAAGDVVCGGGALPGTPVTITFAQAYAGTNVSLITGNGASLTGGSSNVGNIATEQVGSAGVNNKYQFFRSSTGTNLTVPSSAQWFTVDKDGNKTNSTAFDPTTATAAEMKALLVGMTVGYNIGYEYVNHVITTDDIDITVSGGRPIVEFKGNFAGRVINTSYTTLAPGNIGIDLTTAYRTQVSTLIMELQSFEIIDVTLTGSFTLTVYDDGGSPHTTATINYDNTDPDDLKFTIQDAINEALGENAVYVFNANIAGDNWEFNVLYQNYGYQGVNITELTISAGSVSVIETTQGDPGLSEIHKIEASGTQTIRAGSFTITYDGQTTGSIAHNASAATIQIALEALSNVDPGDVTVSSGPISQNAVFLTWSPSLGNINLISVANSLVNSILTVSEYLAGGLETEVQEIIRNKGPECFDDPLNYDPAGLPSDGDILLFEFGQNNCKWGLKQRDTFTVDTSTELCTLGTKRPLFQDGQAVRLRTTGVAPTGLTAGNAYYIINADTQGNLQLSTTLGGSAVNITGAGSGTHTLELTLGTLRKTAKYAYDIGLPRNNEGFEEYRPRYLEAAITNLILGEGDGSDSSLTRFNLGTTVSSITVYNTGSASEPDTPACCILNDNASTDLLAYGGSIGMPPWLDEECEIHDLKAFDTEIKAVGTLTMNNLTLDKGCIINGNFIVNGTMQIGL